LTTPRHRFDSTTAQASSSKGGACHREVVTTSQLLMPGLRAARNSMAAAFDSSIRAQFKTLPTNVVVVAVVVVATGSFTRTALLIRGAALLGRHL
jgi:hypothetical protein